VQNKLSDLFSLTQFLEFHPLDTHANARKYILEPLSRNDPQGLENLRLALHAISLRRARQACSTRQRFERVENVILNETEKELYVRTREQARKLAALSTGKAQGDVVLRAISTLRQICSHGDSTIPKSESCDKCGNPIPNYDNSQRPFLWYLWSFSMLPMHSQAEWRRGLRSEWYARRLLDLRRTCPAYARSRATR